MLFIVREYRFIENVLECGYARYPLNFFPRFYMLAHNGLPHVGQRRCDLLPEFFAFFNSAEYAFATDFPVFFVLSFFFFQPLVVVVVSVVTVCFADITDSYSAIHRCTDRR